MRKLLVPLCFLQVAIAEGASSVRREGDRFWIECRSASLEEILREIAALAPIELWLEEGVSSRTVSASIEGLPLKKALRELFEDVDVNYVLYSDPARRDGVAKIYAGSGADRGRLGREPTRAASAAPVESPQVETPELPAELDPESLLESPEAQDALAQLRELFERQAREEEASEQAADEAHPERPAPLPPVLQELLRSLPQVPPGAFTPASEPKKNPQQ